MSAIAAGSLHSLALKNGGVIAWGSNSFNQITVPTIAQNNVVRISAGELHNLALKPLSPPSITAGAALTRQQGSVGSVSTIATVSDTETPVGNLTVTATTVPAGITVSSITNANGTITASVATGCSAVLGANTVVLTVRDGIGETASANLTVNVTANTAPTLTYSAASVITGASTFKSPTIATDNGSIASCAVRSPGTYTGIISVNAVGAVSIINAAPIGNHTITIRATDNCGATRDASFTLSVVAMPASAVIGWGNNSSDQVTIPVGAKSGITAIAGGASHSLALKNGGVIGWGNNSSGQVTVPVAAQSGVTAIAAQGYHGLALKNGGVIAWGDNSSGQVSVPVAAQSGVTAIAAGGNHSLALKNGGVIGWGNNVSGQVNIPLAAQSGVIAIAAGQLHSLALTSNGRVIGWGADAYGQATIPAAAQSSVVAIAAAGDFGLALKSTGEVIGWGQNASGQVTIPAAAKSGVMAIAAGYASSLALKSTGAVVGWGYDGNGQVTIPAAAQSGVLAISAGGSHSLALKPLSPPSITAGAALTRQQGSVGSVSTIATVSDTETPVGNLTVTATTVPAGLSVTSITNTSGTIRATVAAGCTVTLGAKTIVLTATDGNGQTATANLTVNVTANTAPVLTYAAVSVNGGGSTTNSPTAATDNGSITSYAVQSKGTYTGTITVSSSGVVSISAAAPVGAHTITIRATDNCGATKDASFTLTVNNTAPTFTPAAISRQQGSSAGAPVKIGTVTDAQTAAGTLTVTQITGGTATGITVTGINNNNGTIRAVVTASCTATPGTVIFRVSDGSLTGTSNLQVNVTANTAPTLTYAAASVNSGASTTNTPTAATDNGSITSYAVQSKGTYTGTITVSSSGVVSISAAAPVGTHTITIRATDNCGATKDVNFTLNVECPTPTVSITQPSSGAIYAVGTTANFAGAFVDASGGSHIATWTIDSNTFAGAVNEEARTVSGVYTFTESGVYQLTLTVGNACGQQGSSNLVSGLTAMVVVYDPSGGYVTGQGSINSPAGAYPADPSSTGNASFGFVSKYMNGDTVPSGTSEFQFMTANLSFSSTSYEWLVISGARVQYKGSGTINNAGNYGFLLTVIDGQIQGGGDVDKFRIKIWDKATNLLVYDNQINDPDSADPSTALSSGRIIIETSTTGSQIAAVAEYGTPSNQEASSREVKRSGAASEWHIILVGKDGKQSVVRGGSDGPYFDLVAPGDYDGDGEIDLGIFRRATGGWLIWRGTDRSLITRTGNASATVNRQ